MIFAILLFAISLNESTEKRIFSNEITYPFYSNRTSESVQCSSDLCNNDESFYENSVTKFDHHDENVTCYTCTGQRDSDPDSCRMPDESTPTCEAGLTGRSTSQFIWAARRALIRVIIA